jgi:hypothetical protein
MILLFNILGSVFSEKMQTIASFKSNFKLGKATNTKNNMRASSNSHLRNNNKFDPSAPSFVNSTPNTEPTATELIKKAGDDLPDQSVYYQGWVKYFRYMENGYERPNKFFKNLSFEKQVNNTSSGVSSDKFGSVKIPSEKHFFLILYKDTANILTSRENPLMQVADSLIIDFIKTIPEDNNYLGGVEDFGKFAEGSCLEISTVKPGAFFQMTADETEPSRGLKEKWLICSDSDVSKKQIMNILIKLKLKKQHSLGVYISTPNDPNDPKNKKSLSPGSNQPTLSDVLGSKSGSLSDPDKLNDPNRNGQDGYWIILQNWTPCTLKCGGGLQYLQLMCVPPKRGGKACQGEAIRTKPCNAQPCPKIETVKTLLPQNNQANPTQTIEKPIVRVMAISNRPQRYDKCYIKDSDALMVMNDKSTANMENLPKIPIRLVMNNKSISVYQDETLHTNLMTFLLKNTVFARVKNNSRCFLLNGLNTKAEFCELDSSAGNFVEEWDYDFNLFKHQCHQRRETVELAEMEDDKLAKDYKNKLNQLKLDMVEKKAEKVKMQVENNEEMKLKKKIEQTQAMTLMAIQREFKMEEMLEKEEEEREREEQQTMATQIENEKKKNECLTKSIKEKQIEDQMNLTKANAEEAIQKIKEEAKKQIMVKRAQIKKRIDNMRKKNKRRLGQMQNEIVSLRVEAAGKVQKFAKIGNIKNCFNPGNLQAASVPKIEEYCQINFADSNSKFMDCKSPDSFCFICCENEFGDMHIKERETCYKDICEQENAKPSTIVVASGH